MVDFLSNHILVKSLFSIPTDFLCFLCIFENCISYFSTKTYVVGSQKNHLKEMVLLTPKTYAQIGKKIMTMFSKTLWAFVKK